MDRKLNANQKFDQLAQVWFDASVSHPSPMPLHSEGSNSRPRVLDLFCGTGGFTRGLLDSGYEVAASVDIDEILTSSHSLNFPSVPLRIADIGALSARDLIAIAGGEIDGIVGGPPCQGFSNIGKRDPSDPRRALLKCFFELVSEIGPKFFVMENVLGLGQTDAKRVLESALTKLDSCYHISAPFVLDASDYGAATTRRRLFVVGTRKDNVGQFSIQRLQTRRQAPATVAQAIADLADPKRLTNEDGFDVWKIARRGRASNYSHLMRRTDGKFTGHLPTEHTEKVRLRFSSVPEGGVDRIGRHPRLAWNGQCPTLRAGTGADRGSFQSVRPIHPSEDRVITVREAARLQGFPDDHRFHPTIWHSFRMIGNSVSPFAARAILRELRDVLEAGDESLAASKSVSEMGACPNDSFPHSVSQ